MYSFSYLEPVCCPMSSSNCCFLTCIQISQEADQVVWQRSTNILNTCTPMADSKWSKKCMRVSSIYCDKKIEIYQRLVTCFLRNLYAGQEARVRTGHGTPDWFQIGKGVHQGYILSPCLFNLYAEYIMKTMGQMKHKLESRLPGEMSITQDIQMTPPLQQKVKRN